MSTRHAWGGQTELSQHPCRQGDPSGTARVAAIDGDHGALDSTGRNLFSRPRERLLKTYPATTLPRAMHRRGLLWPECVGKRESILLDTCLGSLVPVSPSLDKRARRYAEDPRS